MPVKRTAASSLVADLLYHCPNPSKCMLSQIPAAAVRATALPRTSAQAQSAKLSIHPGTTANRRGHDIAC